MRIGFADRTKLPPRLERMVITVKAFEKYHPAALLTYFLAVTLFPMFLNNPFIQGLSLFGALLLCPVFFSKRELLRGAGYIIMFMILITVTNPLFSHNGATVLFFINDSAVTLEALVCGAGNALTIAAVVLWFQILSQIMTSDKWLALTGKRLPRLTLVLSMALRFVPLFTRRLKKVQSAQKTLGFYASDNYPDKLKSGLNVFSILVAWSLENAAETSFSMDARGYGLPGRTQFTQFHFGRGDLFLLIITVLTTAFVLFGAARGAADFAYYPTLTVTPLSGFAAAVYLPYAALALIPFFSECKEIIRWKYCVSKI